MNIVGAVVLIHYACIIFDEYGRSCGSDTLYMHYIWWIWQELWFRYIMHELYLMNMAGAVVQIHYACIIFDDYSRSCGSDTLYMYYIWWIWQELWFWYIIHVLYLMNMAGAVVLIHYTCIIFDEYGRSCGSVVLRGCPESVKPRDQAWSSEPREQAWSAVIFLSELESHYQDEEESISALMNRSFYCVQFSSMYVIGLKHQSISNISDRDDLGQTHYDLKKKQP